MKKQTRSSKYQFVYNEILIEQPFLEAFLDDTSEEHNEALLDLLERRRERYWSLLKEHCTPHQLKVCKSLASGRNQLETAFDTNSTSQSNIHKSLYGNIRYQNGDKKTYGGIIIKLRRYAAIDSELAEIEQLILDLG